MTSYDEACPEAHSAAVRLRAGDNVEADRVAGRVNEGDGLPDVPRWICLARHRLGGLNAALPLLVRFAWLAQERVVALVAELGDPALERAWRNLLADLGNLDATWFSAWFLHEHPGANLAAEGAPQHVMAAAANAVLIHVLKMEGLRVVVWVQMS